MTGANPTIAALVPMRHSSERVKGKNYRPLGGKPLFHHIVDTLLAVPEIEEIAIDTDSPVIAESVAQTYPGARIIERPDHLLGGDVPMTDVLAYDISLVEADLYLQTHSTNPLLRPETVRDGIRAFLEAGDSFDSLFSVTPWHTRLWSSDGKPLNHDPSVLLRTQDLPPVMEENSCLYLFTGELLRRTGRRIGDRPLLFPIEGDEASDIDEESDWRVVEALYEYGMSKEREAP